jgi:hypothetical protein
MIELVYHPLGLEDAAGNPVEVEHNATGLRWRQVRGAISNTVAEG